MRQFGLRAVDELDAFDDCGARGVQSPIIMDDILWRGKPSQTAERATEYGLRGISSKSSVARKTQAFCFL
jgi:hypothetical protein